MTIKLCIFIEVFSPIPRICPGEKRVSESQSKITVRGTPSR
jgi:hypothetical protein